MIVTTSRSSHKLNVSLQSPAPKRRLRRLALKPYGDELLTRSGEFWIFCARLIIVIMASAEAISWGYMGSLMGRVNPIVSSAIAGSIIFGVIWIVDATFMTLDLSRAFYERELIGKKPEPLKERLKFWTGVLARLVIVLGSLYITAPFLAQVIFSRDVDTQIERKNSDLIAKKRSEIEKPFVDQLTKLREQKSSLEQERVKEAAGVGLSGRYGRGDALKTIEMQLDDKSKEISGLEARRVSALTDLDSMSREELARAYGLDFLGKGVQSSGEVLKELLANPAYTNAELAIRAFLSFLFIGLFILKVFQPRSIAVYYNEQLHSIYDQYKKGIFDNYLPPAEQASAGGSIDPLRFEDWCLNTYAVIRKEDERRRDAEKEYQAHVDMIEKWSRLDRDARAELTPLITKYEENLNELHELENELHDANAKLDENRLDAAATEKTLQSMVQHIDGGGMDGPTFSQAIRAKLELEQKLRNLRSSISASEGDVENISKRSEVRRNEAEVIQNEIHTKQSVIEDAQKRIGEERLRFSETISSHHKP